MIAILNSRLEVTDRFTPDSMGLNLEERKSTANVNTGLDAPDIACGAWVKDETEPGKGIIWRVRSNEKQFDRKTKTLQLEHVINTLRDSLIFGELTPAMIAGGNATTCTARQAAKKVLSYQNIWALGDFEFNVSNPYSFNGEDCFSAMETITSSLEGAYWEYDLTRLPFRLHVRKLPEDVSCEMRMNRNIQTIRMTVDRSRMFTRFYPIGNDNLTLPGRYVSRNEGAYGVISKTETDQSKRTEAELIAWANERLRNHAEPSVTVTISGMDWSEATGEPLDKLQINKICRVPLPEYGTYIEEKVTKLSWSNKVAEPERVTATLANLITDVASILNNSAKASSRSGRTAAKKAEEDHAWFEDTTDHVAMVAEAVAGEGAAEDWSRVAAIVVDGNGIHQRVTKTEGDIVVAQTAIEANENAIILEAKRASEAEGELSSQLTVTAEAITAEVKRASDAEGELSGRLDVTAEAITAEVTRASTAEGELSGRITVTAEAVTTEVERAKGAENSLSGRITTEAGKISLVVEETAGGNVIKAASIVTAVNNAGSSVAISADHVSITGDTKLSGTLTVSDGSLVVKKSAVFQGNVTLQDANGILEAKNYVVKGGGHVRFTGAGAGEYYDLTPSNIQGFIKSASVSGNVLTLTPVYGNAITFSKATSLSGAWSGGDFTATAKQNNVTVGTVVTKLQDIELSGDVGLSGTYVSQTAKVMYGEDDDEQFTPTGYQGTIYINVASKLQQGSASSAGTYNPASGYVGFSSFTVSGVGGGDKARFGSDQGSYYIEAYDSSTGTGVSGSSVQYTLKAGYTAGSGILVDVCDTGGTKIANTASCPIWMTISSGPVNDQGLMNYDTYYGIVSGNTVLATWKTPPDNTPEHSVTLYQVLEEDVDGSTSTVAYHGTLYNANGDAVFAGKYWYYCTTNIGKSKTIYWD